ncbi:IS66 family insertion sequence element accessory protein TnpB [Roseateles sp. GG27B]
MDTLVFVESPGLRTHRREGAEFKAQVVLASRQPVVSIAAVALANGLNANMLRRWTIDARLVGPLAVSCQPAVTTSAKSATAEASGLAGFVAVQMLISPAAWAEPDIHIELTRGPTTHRHALAGIRCRCLWDLAARDVSVIRIDSLWLAVEPVDMRAGGGRLLVRAVQVFCGAQAHHSYLFANALATRIKLLVHDGSGVWCAVRRLNLGGFDCSREGSLAVQSLALTQLEFDALVLGLPRCIFRRTWPVIPAT